jgi:hopene-associated glycosyltransferase HpnB
VIERWAEAAGVISATAWVYLLFGRGAFWRVRDQAHACEPAVSTGLVAAIIPARNEAAVVDQAIASLLGQDYTGDLAIFVVDDHSSDNTAAVARSAADRAGCSERVAVLQASRLQAGWTGKLWALSEGVKRASMLRPEYFLFTDADIVHARDNVAQLVARVRGGTGLLPEAEAFDLVSFMVKLRCVSFAERALIPAFVFFFFQLYPPNWIARSDRTTAGAAGGCILIRREMLSQIGGLARIRSELIDDCALAREVKRHGGRVWLGLSSTTHSIREYGSFNEIEKMISRTAYTQLRYSPILLAATLAALTIIYLLPPLLLLSGDKIAMGAGIFAWILMSLSFVPALRFYGRLPASAVLLPLIACLYMAATLHSAWLHWRGRGGAWKERVQAL